MRSVLSGVLNMAISAEGVVTRSVRLLLDFSADRGTVTLSSGWPTLLFGESAPLSPGMHSLRVTLSTPLLTGIVQPSGFVALPLALHLDYEPNAGAGQRDQDVGLALISTNTRIWDQAPLIALSGHGTYETYDFGPFGRMVHSIDVSLNGTVNPPPALYLKGETVWFDGALPDGANPHSDHDCPFLFEPAACTGLSAVPIPPGYPLPPPHNKNCLCVHTSCAAPGMSQHYFEDAVQTLTVAAGERLFAYIYVDTVSAASFNEIMLQWNDGSWEHRAFWGSDLIPFGVSGTNSRRRVADLPPAGVWTRLEVPAAAVGLEGRTISGMAFTVSTGHAMGLVSCVWARAGKLLIGT